MANAKKEVMDGLVDLERSINSMSEALYKHKDNGKFLKAFMKFNKAHLVITGSPEIPHIITEAKSLWRNPQVAKAILAEIDHFISIRDSIREILEEDKPLDELKDLFEQIERHWCKQSTLHRIKGQNLLAVYRRCVLSYGG